jgi:hypothetical protein
VATFPKHFHDGGESNVVARPPAAPSAQEVKHHANFELVTTAFDARNT